MTKIIDIKAKAPWPACALSNFAAHPFVYSGFKAASMEGFLQALKIEDDEEQYRVRALTGKEAKEAGQAYPNAFGFGGNLNFGGWILSRHDRHYQEILFDAYDALFEQSEDFREALRATGDAVLTHSIGSNDPTKTILTECEFLMQLYRLRAKL